MFNDLEKMRKRHSNLSKLSMAFFYAIAVSIALNFFWQPGKIYSSGVTGAAQVIASLSEKIHIPLTTPVLYFALNIPLFILAWFKIGHHFTAFTFLAVLFSTIMMHLMPAVHITNDPIVCAIFGGLINGMGTGMALKNNISTGGLDIIGIIIRKKTGRSMGSINIFFNLIIILAAGFVFGWVHALYSAMGIFINGRVIDMVYTSHQRLQVMIITNQPKQVINEIQHSMRRGITIVHDAEGAFKHEEKTILFTVISRYEMHDLSDAMAKSDPYAFVSITESFKIMGHFYEPKVE
ncbi:YitT family protein [Lapidilactobacillus salsurivasis]